MPQPPLRDEFEALLAETRRAAEKDPFTNPYLLFALAGTRRMASGAVSIEALSEVVGDICADGFLDRARRFGGYLGEFDGKANQDALASLFARLAGEGFEAYAEALARPGVGIVTTAHPTFALDEDSALRLVQLASLRGLSGEPLPEAVIEDLQAQTRSRAPSPPDALTLDLEHAWSVRALSHALQALQEARMVALQVAQAHWPERWTELRPNLLTLATWVGFDQDGRTDVTWLISVGKRLELKAAALRRLAAQTQTAAPAMAARLQRACEIVDRQLTGLEVAARDPRQTAAFSRAMVLGRDASLTDPGPLLQDLETALAAAESDETRRLLIGVRADLETQGVCLAHIHVRLNAAQLHNAIRREVGLETAPADPANRRAYFAAINRLIGACAPTTIGFQSVLEEPTSAKRLFIAIAQMKKFIDARAPVRFLIAETESGFTLLVALYYARMFGVEDVVEISPLFETAEALARGEAVIEEALRSPHFRQYLRRQGRICIEFGFSDSGRFIGQMAATFRIERLRLRLAELLEREGLQDLEVVLFNTHGESIGRGGHPSSLQDRLSYCAPPQNREEFTRRGLRVREEDSFQGGDGYLALLTPPAALASIRGLLQFAFAPPPPEPDPIYERPDFASDFFASIQQSFEALARDRDYAGLLSLFGTRILNRTGSRPEQRQVEGGSQIHTFAHVSELRAIPNNAILQGMGDLANTTFGVAAAAAKDPETFEQMMKTSARFRQAMQMACAAEGLGDLPATRAYAASVNPSLWLDRRAGAPETELGLLYALTALAERAGMTASLSRALRRLRAEPAFPLAVEDGPRRERMRLLHALRVTLIQRIAMLAAKVPPFTPFDGVTREDVQVRILRLDVAAAVEILVSRFPARRSPPARSGDFGETPAYDPGADQGYAREHAEIFEPLLALFAALKQTTTALDQEIGACG